MPLVYPVLSTAEAAKEHARLICDRETDKRYVITGLVPQGEMARIGLSDWQAMSDEPIDDRNIQELGKPSGPELDQALLERHHRRRRENFRLHLEQQ